VPTSARDSVPSTADAAIQRDWPRASLLAEPYSLTVRWVFSARRCQKVSRADVSPASASRFVSSFTWVPVSYNSLPPGTILDTLSGTYTGYLRCDPRSAAQMADCPTAEINCNAS